MVDIQDLCAAGKLFGGTSREGYNARHAGMHWCGVTLSMIETIIPGSQIREAGGATKDAAGDLASKGREVGQAASEDLPRLGDQAADQVRQTLFEISFKRHSFVHLQPPAIRGTSLLTTSSRSASGATAKGLPVRKSNNSMIIACKTRMPTIYSIPCNGDDLFGAQIGEAGSQAKDAIGQAGSTAQDYAKRAQAEAKEIKPAADDLAEQELQAADQVGRESQNLMCL